jgi:hypothetical protein
MIPGLTIDSVWGGLAKERDEASAVEVSANYERRSSLTLKTRPLPHALVWRFRV